MFRVYIHYLTNQRKHLLFVIVLSICGCGRNSMWKINTLKIGSEDYNVKEIWIQVTVFRVCTTNWWTVTSSSFPWSHFFTFLFLFISSILSYIVHSICVKLFSFDFHLCLNYHSLMAQDSNQDFVEHLLSHRNRNIYVTFKFMGFNTQTHHIKSQSKANSRNSGWCTRRRISIFWIFSKLWDLDLV